MSAGARAVPSAGARSVAAQRRRLAHRVLVYAGLGLYSLLAVFPLYWLFKSSFTVGLDLIAAVPSFLPGSVDLSNYQRVFSVGLITTFFANSLKLALLSTFFTILIASLAAYSLSRFRYRGRDLIQRTVLLAYMFPGILLAVPLTLLYVQIGLINSHGGLLVAYVTFSLPFALWLLIAYFETIPHEIDEAARVDGATHLDVFVRIILPLAAPGIVTAAIFAFLGAWNEFILGLVLIQQNELKTVPVGLALFLRGGPGDTIEWGGRMAAGVLVIVPSLIFFLLASGRIARGLAAGAVKG
ncbi:MAG TPA: carbohydrate ABC transporter permease [Chloroflexota bacterium]|jgi:ABC-type glycerol-3-phosphate transport system permease component|nr:carbohydrate ABC transporter permease [Chloroflexota bacterium]